MSDGNNKANSNMVFYRCAIVDVRGVDFWSGNLSHCLASCAAESAKRSARGPMVGSIIGDSGIDILCKISTVQKLMPLSAGGPYVDGHLYSQEEGTDCFKE